MCIQLALVIPTFAGWNLGDPDTPNPALSRRMRSGASTTGRDIQAPFDPCLKRGPGTLADVAVGPILDAALNPSAAMRGSLTQTRSETGFRFLGTRLLLNIPQRGGKVGRGVGLGSWGRIRCLQGIASGLTRTIHGSRPTGALRASKFVPDKFVEPRRAQRGSGSPVFGVP